MGEQQGHLELLCGQLVERARVAPPRRLARSLQLDARLLRPRARAEAVEARQRCAKVLPGSDALAGAPKPPAVGELGARRLEGVGGPSMQLESLLEVVGEVVVAGQQGAAARGTSERPWLSLRGGGDEEGLRSTFRFAARPDSQVELGALRGR